MKASELINELQTLLNEHGDLPVNFDGGSFESPVEDIFAYDRHGKYPSANEAAAEFYIHTALRRSPSTPTS